MKSRLHDGLAAKGLFRSSLSLKHLNILLSILRMYVEAYETLSH